jgi:hypothetical protein
MRIQDMSKLNAQERKDRDNARFSQRVDERRVKGEDVVAYALANKKAYKFLTKDEKYDLKQRQIVLEQEAKLTVEEKIKLRTERELEKAKAAFTQE